MNSRGYIPLTPRFARTRDRPTSSTVALPPDEILFRSKGAPDRNDEDINHDIYSWTRTLPAGLELPESDLLTAVHSYVADFYGTLPDSKNDFESLDGTALIAMSMLLEEMAGEALGKTGDLALTEAAGEDSAQQPKWWNGKREVPHVLVQYTVADRMMCVLLDLKHLGNSDQTAPGQEMTPIRKMEKPRRRSRLQRRNKMTNLQTNRTTTARTMKMILNGDPKRKKNEEPKFSGFGIWMKCLNPPKHRALK